MSPYDLVLIVLVGAGAFFAGYQLGRFKALAEQGASRAPYDDGPLPGPRPGREYADTSAAPTRPRGGPPPASAGNDGGSSPRRDGPPRRSSKPPPAAAGLMGTGSTEKPDTRQK